MAVIRWNFPNGNDTDALTPALAGADTTNVTGGPATISTTQAIIGTRSTYMLSNATGHIWFAKESLSTTTVAVDMYLYIATAPSAEFYQIWCGSSSSTRSVGIRMLPDRTLRLSDNASTSLWTSSAIPLASWVRISLYATINATTGTALAEWYNGHSTTAQSSSGTLTGLNTGTNVDRIRVGFKAASATGTGDGYVGSWAYDTAATGLIAPYSAGTAVTTRRRDAGAWTTLAPQLRVAGTWQAKTGYKK